MVADQESFKTATSSPDINPDDQDMDDMITAVEVQSSPMSSNLQQAHDQPPDHANPGDQEACNIKSESSLSIKSEPTTLQSPLLRPKVPPLPSTKTLSRKTIVIILLTILAITLAIVGSITIIYVTRSTSTKSNNGRTFFQRTVIDPSLPIADQALFSKPTGFCGQQITFVEGSNIGRYEVAKGRGSGVVAIHAGVMPNNTGKVVFMERWDVHGTQAMITVNNTNITAWSVEYDYTTDTFRPLTLQTNLFCAGGMLLPDGRLMVVGGAENESSTWKPEIGVLSNGEKSIRLFSGSGYFGSFGTTDWIDEPYNLNLSLALRYLKMTKGGGQDRRWYPTVQTLPDGRLIIMGGSNSGVEFNDATTNTASFEILPHPNPSNPQSTPLQFLWDTLPANLYPVTTLLPSGKLFLFAGDRSTVLDPLTGYQILPQWQLVVGVSNPYWDVTTNFTVDSKKRVGKGVVDQASSKNHKEKGGDQRKSISADGFNCLAQGQSAADGTGNESQDIISVLPCQSLYPGSQNFTTAPVSMQTFVVWPVDGISERDVGLIFVTASKLCFSLNMVGGRIQLMPCDSSNPAQVFRFNNDSTISHRSSQTCLSYSKNAQYLTSGPCNSTDPSFLFGRPQSNLYFEFPRLPPGPFRSYPWTGSSTLLPLDTYNNYKPTILICGGSALPCGWTCVDKSCHDSCQNENATAISSCGLIRPDDDPFSASNDNLGSLLLNDANSNGAGGQWDMVQMDMPVPRVMGDMVNLPDGTVLLVNGGMRGMAGWDKGRDPAFQALLYLPLNKKRNQHAPLKAVSSATTKGGNVGTISPRWKLLNSTTIPRLYHSVAMLLPDGRVMIAGSAPNDPIDLNSPHMFDNEYRIEYYLPPYLTQSTTQRPNITKISSVSWTTYNSSVTVGVSSSPSDCPIEFALIQSGFRTHSMGHGQRMVWLVGVSLANLTKGMAGNIEAGDWGVLTPPRGSVAPPGWYMLFAVCQGVPSEAVWVQVGGDPANVSRMG
ncbi:hypothetical protein HDU76_013995 [Blyttiomyces sp. JEL0837]|nr:hypothetical protein HDU76_013995 [Blyttiomyces sp. JEL0837]